MNMEAIFSVINTTKAVVKKRPEKNSVGLKKKPVGLIAQLVEQCTGIARVMGLGPIQAWIFFRPSFCYCLSSVHYYEDRFHIRLNS